MDHLYTSSDPHVIDALNLFTPVDPELFDQLTYEDSKGGLLIDLTHDIAQGLREGLSVQHLPSLPACRQTYWLQGQLYYFPYNSPGSAFDSEHIGPTQIEFSDEHNRADLWKLECPHHKACHLPAFSTAITVALNNQAARTAGVLHLDAIPDYGPENTQKRSEYLYKHRSYACYHCAAFCQPVPQLNTTDTSQALLDALEASSDLHLNRAVTEDLHFYRYNSIYQKRQNEEREREIQANRIEYFRTAPDIEVIWDIIPLSPVSNTYGTSNPSFWRTNVGPQDEGNDLIWPEYDSGPD
jgi:hypothetical protein